MHSRDRTLVSGSGLLPPPAPLPSLQTAFAQRRAIFGAVIPDSEPEHVGPVYTPANPPPFDTWPAVYSLRCFGGCCEPEIGDGSSVIIDHQVPPKQGDFVAIWGLGRSGTITALVKRLVTTLPPWTRFPAPRNPGSELHEVVVVETLNPPKRFVVDLSTVYAVHRCIGVAAARPDIAIGTDVPWNDIRWFDQPSKPAPKRRLRVAGGAAHA